MFVAVLCIKARKWRENAAEFRHPQCKATEIRHWPSARARVPWGLGLRMTDPLGSWRASGWCRYWAVRLTGGDSSMAHMSSIEVIGIIRAISSVMSMAAETLRIHWSSPAGRT